MPRANFARIVAACVAGATLGVAYFDRSIALAVAVALTLLTMLVIGWREALRTTSGESIQLARFHWVHLSLLAVIIGAEPVLPVLVLSGIERYGHVPFIPWVILLKR